MAMQAHLTWGWVYKATADDRRTGFVMMTRAELATAIAEDRAQDPRVGALHLKFITRELWTPPEPEQPEVFPPTARRNGKSKPAPIAAPIETPPAAES